MGAGLWRSPMEFRFKGGPRPFQRGACVEEMGELCLKIVAGPQFGPRRRGGFMISVHRAKPFEGEPPHQVDEGHFGSVGGGGEHAFAEEHAAERHAIKSTHQVFSVPCLHGMGQPEVMEVDVRLNDVFGDPCAFAHAVRAGNRE